MFIGGGIISIGVKLLILCAITAVMISPVPAWAKILGAPKRVMAKTKTAVNKGVPSHVRKYNGLGKSSIQKMRNNDVLMHKRNKKERRRAEEEQRRTAAMYSNAQLQPNSVRGRYANNPVEADNKFANNPISIDDVDIEEIPVKRKDRKLLEDKSKRIVRLEYERDGE